MVLPRWCWLGFRPWSAAVQFSKGSVDIGQHSAPPEPSQHYRVLDHSKPHSKPLESNQFPEFPTVFGPAFEPLGVVNRRRCGRVTRAAWCLCQLCPPGRTAVTAISFLRPHSHHSCFALGAGGAGLAGGILTAQAETGGNGFGSLPDCDAFVWLVFFSQGSAAQPSER